MRSSQSILRITLAIALSMITVAASRAAVDPEDLAIADRLQNVFVDVAQTAFPATVVITSTRQITMNTQQIPDEMRDLFEQFRRWQTPGPDSPGAPAPNQIPRQSLGSGFFISDDGYILTNSHVIEGADEIKVQLKDGREDIAEVGGAEPPSDVALIKVDMENVPYLKLGDSDAVKIGQWALAVGAPLHFDYTFTTGVVSAKGRSLPLPASRVQYTEQEYLQVDALINPGNSGGPLLNTKGEVIGINTLISGQFGYYGFAVPINIAKRVADSIREEGRVVRPWIGIVMEELSLDEQSYYGIDGGVRIARISDESPAKKQGLEVGDVITAIDGETTNTPVDLKKMVLTHKPGDEIEITYLHKGKEDTKTITLAEVPESLTSVAGIREPITPKGQETIETWGITVDDISSEVREQIGLDEDHGLIITEVKSQSPAEKAGILAGDVILEVNYNKINNADDLVKYLGESNQDKGALFYLYRQGEYGFRLVKPTE